MKYWSFNRLLIFKFLGIPLISFSLIPRALAQVSTLQCKKTSGEDVAVHVYSDSLTFALVDQKHSYVKLLQKIIPQLPKEKLLGFGCVSFRTKLPRAACQFTDQAEVFQCSVGEAVTLKVSAALFCNQARDDWEHFEIVMQDATLTAEHFELEPGKNQQYFKLRWHDEEDELELHSVYFNLWQDSMGQGSAAECRLDGELMLRP